MVWCGVGSAEAIGECIKCAEVALVALVALGVGLQQVRDECKILSVS